MNYRAVFQICSYVIYHQVYLYDEENVTPNNTNEELFSEEYSFIRKRTTINSAGEEAGSVYGWTQVQKTHEGQIIERKRIITKREYYSLFNNRDKSRHIVKQKRISFLWNIQSFTIHVYKEPVSDICILHAQVRSTSPEEDNEEEDDKKGEVEIPTFLEVEKRLMTDSEADEHYGAYHLSLKD